MNGGARQIPGSNKESLFLLLEYGFKKLRDYKHLHTQSRLKQRDDLLWGVLFVCEK